MDNNAHSAAGRAGATRVVDAVASADAALTATIEAAAEDGAANSRRNSPGPLLNYATTPFHPSIHQRGVVNKRLSTLSFYIVHIPGTIWT